MALKLWITFLILMGIVITVAYKQKPVLAFLHLDACKLPCWIGIIPGKTTVGETKILIAKYYSSKGYKVILDNTSAEVYDDLTGRMLFRAVSVVHKLTPADDDITQSLELQFRETTGNITLGDIFMALDRPDQTVPWGMGGGTFPSLIYERHNVVVVTAKEMAEREPPVCVHIQDAVSFIAIFPDPPRSDFWPHGAVQMWLHFPSCLQMIEDPTD